jgi:hypothetical protein
MNPSAMNAPSTARSDAAVAVDVSPPTTRPAGVWTLASALSILVWIVTMGVGGLAGFRLGVQAGSPLVAMLSAVSGALFCSILADALIRWLRGPR